MAPLSRDSVSQGPGLTAESSVKNSVQAGLGRASASWDSDGSARELDGVHICLQIILIITYKEKLKFQV